MDCGSGTSMRIRPRFARGLLVALAVAAVAAAPAFGQSIQVDPPSAPAGTEITVEAFDFAPGEIVTLQFGGQTLAEGQADDEGFIRLVGTIPDLPPGEHPLLVGSESAQVDLMYEVLEATETPTETEPEVEGEGPAVVETEPTETGAAAAGSDDGGIPWWPIAVVGGLLLVGTGFLVGKKADKKPAKKPPPPDRTPGGAQTAGGGTDAPTGTTPAPAGGAGADAPTQIIPGGPAVAPPLLGGTRTRTRASCPEWKREKRKQNPYANLETMGQMDAAAEIVELKMEPDSGGVCVWWATFEWTYPYHVDLYHCRLDAGHKEPHSFSDKADGRDPPEAGTFYEEKARSSGRIREDPTCAMSEEEVRARYRLFCNVCGEVRGDAVVCPHCEMGDPGDEPLSREKVLEKWREQQIRGQTTQPDNLLNQAPCRVCGEPRGNLSPCPHCGMA